MSMGCTHIPEMFLSRTKVDVCHVVSCISLFSLRSNVYQIQLSRHAAEQTKLCLCTCRYRRIHPHDPQMPNITFGNYWGSRSTARYLLLISVKTDSLDQSWMLAVFFCTMSDLVDYNVERMLVTTRSNFPGRLTHSPVMLYVKVYLHLFVFLVLVKCKTF